MAYFTESEMYQKETLVAQQMAQQKESAIAAGYAEVRKNEAEQLLGEFSKQIATYDKLINELTDRLASLCVCLAGNPNNKQSSTCREMSPVGAEFDSRIAMLEELNERLRMLMRSVTF